MTGVVARILLRVTAGILIGKGWFAPEDANALTADPELSALVEMGIGAGVWAATEAWYWAAKKFGWTT